MYEMKDKKEEKKKGLCSAKECAYIAVFVSLLIALQLAFSLVPGVEMVTVMFVVYAFVFGCGRGALAATAFSLLRQVVFGVHATVLVLYLVYFNLLALLFGYLGKIMRQQKDEWKGKKLVWRLIVLTLIACACTVFFTLFDNLLTPLWYGYSARATRAYFYASLTFLLPQTLCTAVTVGTLFLPLRSAFLYAKRGLI